MSAEEDTELRDLVAQTLESKGVLGKIRAQLRASVFLALEEQEGTEGKMPLVNLGLKTFLSTHEGRLVAGLVREFLEYFDLDFSIAVFDPETNFRDKYPGRNHLARELKLDDAESTSNSPLLAEVIRHFSPNTPSEQPAKEAIVVSPRHSATGSPRSTSPPSKVDADDVGDLSSDIDSNDSMPSSPRPSKIPQRVKDDRSTKSEKSLSQDSFLDRLSSSNKELNSRSDSQRERGGKRSPDVTIGSDDEDIFGDSPPKPKIDDVTSRTFRESDKKGSTNEPATKTVGGLSSLKGAPSLGSSTLGSLKGAPPLNNNKDVSNSPDWKDLAEIDNRINKLGFDVPGEDKNGESPDFNDDYEDDFIATSDHSVSIPEDIEEQLSLSSFHSNSAKLDDLLTTDRTVSQASVGDLDFAEDVLKF